MTRTTPKLDGGSVAGFKGIVLTDAQVADISDECGVAVGDARIRIGEALSSYLLLALSRKTAPAVNAAVERLNKLQVLAVELRELNGQGESDAPDLLLRSSLWSELDWPDRAATRLNDVLSDYVGALERVRREVTAGREPQRNPPGRLARELDRIWRMRLSQSRTISASNGGSPFVRFVLAAIACLPSDWPWCSGAKPQPHSLGAFAQALYREEFADEEFDE